MEPLQLLSTSVLSVTAHGHGSAIRLRDHIGLIACNSHVHSHLSLSHPAHTAGSACAYSRLVYLQDPDQLQARAILNRISVVQ